MCEYYDKYWALVEAIKDSRQNNQSVFIDDILFNIDTAQEVPYAP